MPMMNLQLFSKDFEITPAIRQYLEEKLAALERYSDRIIGAHVDVQRDHHHRKGEIYRVEVNLHVPHQILRVVEKAGTFHAGVDEVTERLKILLDKYKGRAEYRRRLRQKFAEARKRFLPFFE